MKIAVIAPPWIPVPPPGYGGIESVIAQLCEGLVGAGHDVTLLAAPGSRSSATVVPVLAGSHPDEIGYSLYAADHAARSWEVVDVMAALGRPFEIIHDHSGYTIVALADRLGVPVVHTVHSPFTEVTAPFYAHHAGKVWLTALSEAQRATAPSGLRWAGVVPNPIDVDGWPLCTDKGDYLLWVGRVTPEKGPQRAIRVARRAGRPLVLAGPVQRGQEQFFADEVQPHIDGCHVRYLHEVGGSDKQELFANAAGFLMPIRWAEPFGMVMVEAMACGTPVLAFPEGAAPEVVIDGRNGYLVDDEDAMVGAVGALGQVEPADCRASVAERYDPALVAAGYEAIYRSIADDQKELTPVGRMEVSHAG